MFDNSCKHQWICRKSQTADNVFFKVTAFGLFWVLLLLIYIVLLFLLFLLFFFIVNCDTFVFTCFNVSLIIIRNEHLRFIDFILFHVPVVRVFFFFLSCKLYSRSTHHKSQCCNNTYSDIPLRKTD